MARNNRNRFAKEKVVNRKRMLDGKEVKPVLYYNNKFKKMITGSVDGELVCDKFGKPLPLRSIGAIE
tara:strand:- start:38 stop:238 length:201 start_codon:yes stop_codon:yes gene_type:complete